MQTDYFWAGVNLSFCFTLIISTYKREDQPKQFLAHKGPKTSVQLPQSLIDKREQPMSWESKLTSRQVRGWKKIEIYLWKKGKGNVCIRAMWPFRPTLISGMKQILLLYFSLDGMRVHLGVTPSIKLDGTHLYSWVERDTMRVKHLVQEYNAVSPVEPDQPCSQSLSSYRTLERGLERAR